MTSVRLIYSWELGAERKLRVQKNDGKSSKSIDARYLAEPQAASEMNLDASSAIGLFRDRRQTISEAENERLERCLSDLLLCQLHPHLQDPGVTIFIQGPPLSKLIGRIGYRYPRPEVTIAFVTVDERYFSPPSYPPATSDGDSDWDGPFPDLQQESLTRRFYFNSQPQVRVDYFTQAMGQIYAGGGEGQQTPDLSLRLHDQTAAILEFAEALRKLRDSRNRRIKVAGEIQSTLFGVDRPVERLAARTTVIGQRSTDDGDATIRPSPQRKKSGLSDSETFRAIFGEPQTKGAKGRREALVTFAKDTDLGSLADIVEFLHFVQRTLEVKKPPGSWVFGPADLRRWFSEHDAGEPFGS
jgi:hypothetical protein